MPNQIPTTQWSRTDEPVLNLSTLRIVAADTPAGFMYTDDTVAPTAGYFVTVDGELRVQESE